MKKYNCKKKKQRCNEIILERKMVGDINLYNCILNCHEIKENRKKMIKEKKKGFREERKRGNYSCLGSINCDNKVIILIFIISE